MKRHEFKPMAVIGGVTLAAAVAALPAQAQTCFIGFSSTVKYNLAVEAATLETPGTYSVAGVTFGALTPCDGLKKWPVVGTVTVTGTSIVLAFRAMTVDAKNCGATDNIVAMTPKRLSGPMQLHNDRKNFSNATTFTETACSVPPPENPFPAFGAPRGIDPQGN
jgi:hypothetical protein